MKAVASLPGGGRVHTLFNTHWHPEQTGLNERLGAAGTTIIAHENTRLWLTTDVKWPWNGRVFTRLPKAARLHGWRRTWYRFRQRRSALIALIFIVLMLLVAVFAPVLAPYSPSDQHLSDRHHQGDRQPRGQPVHTPRFEVVRNLRGEKEEQSDGHEEQDEFPELLRPDAAENRIAH